MNDINNSKRSDTETPNLLQQKIDEFNKKKKNNNAKNFNINYDICSILSILIAASTLGFVGGSIAVKTMGGANAQDTATLADKKALSENASDTAQKTSTTGSEAPLTYSSITSIADRNTKSIAEINTETTKTNASMKQYTSSGAGSGIVVDSDGYILTNNHVISGSNKISVTINSETLDAELVGVDDELDIALLKINKTELQPVIFGDSSNIKVGESVVAIGNPLGQLGGTVTTGIVSALNRDITINNETMSLLQTDAAVNPGNSGGGLFNLQGELIGMVTAKSKSATSEGIGFAIPVNDLKKPLNDLKEFGYIRGRVNIEMGTTDASMLKSSSLYKNYSKGVFITSVPEGSNAQTAGFQVGDCIISINSDEITSVPSLTKTLKNYSAGDTVSVGIMRKEESLTLNLQFAEKNK